MGSGFKRFNAVAGRGEWMNVILKRVIERRAMLAPDNLLAVGILMHDAILESLVEDQKSARTLGLAPEIWIVDLISATQLLRIYRL